MRRPWRIEAPTFAAGSLTQQTGGTTAGTFIQIEDAYAPMGGPGSTTPISGGIDPGVILDPKTPGKGGNLKPPKF